MLRLVNKNIKFPELYPKVERRMPTATDKGYDKVGGFLLREKIDLMPQQGIQENLCACDSNLIFLCGAATMGKTYGMFLKVLTGIDRVGFTARMVSTRLQDSKKGSSIFRDAVEVCGNFGGCEYNSSDYPTFMWKEKNSNLQLIHLNYNVDNPNEWSEFKEYIKKQQASMFLLDEATDMQEKAVMYMFSRNRDSSGAKLQMILSFNPEHKHFTTTVLKEGGYLTDDWYFRPEMNGVTRYFYVAGDTFRDLIWGNSPEEVARAAHIRLTKDEIDAGITIDKIVKSFTAFTGTAADNRKLVAATGGQSIGNLHAVGAQQREVLKGGYFGLIEKEVNDVTRQMIHNLWENPISDDPNMYATMDISSGGKDNDKCPMVIWRGLQIVSLQFFSGKPMEIAGWIRTQLNTYKVPIENFAYDATGHGYWMQGLTNGIAVTSNARAKQELDEFGNPIQAEQFFNLRSQLLGKMKVMFERGDISCSLDKYANLPYGKKGETRQLIDILFDEIHVFVTQQRMRKIYYKSKEEYKERYKHSPDLMDAIMLRAVFELDARPKKKPKAWNTDDVYTNYYNNRPPVSYGYSRW